jgi:hypothetical protein
MAAVAAATVPPFYSMSKQIARRRKSTQQQHRAQRLYCIFARVSGEPQPSAIATMDIAKATISQ